MTYKLIKQDKGGAIIGEPHFVFSDANKGDTFEKACVAMIKLLQSSELDETVEIRTDGGPILRLKVDYKP